MATLLVVRRKEEKARRVNIFFMMNRGCRAWRRHCRLEKQGRGWTLGETMNHLQGVYNEQGEAGFSILLAEEKSAVPSVVLHSEISGLLVARQISFPLFSNGAQFIALC